MSKYRHTAPFPPTHAASLIDPPSAALPAMRGQVADSGSPACCSAGQHLPLALVLSLPTAEFSDRCASYQAWCFEREHLAAGRRLSANEHRKPAHMWRVPARGGGRPEADPAARPDQA